MKTMKKKSILMLAMMVLLLTVTVSGTIAYLAASSDEIVNTFTPGGTDVEIEEPDWDGQTKEDVTIKNTGSIKAYIRAAIVVTWESTTEGSTDVLGTVPVEGEDYKLTLATGTGWTKLQSDGYYYYTTAVEAGEYTGILVDECIQLKEAPDGYALHVEIISSSVQAEPDKTPITELWGTNAAGLVQAVN